MEEKVSFEQSLERLEQVVRELEHGDLSLDKALALFQEGVLLARTCSGQLDAAESQIELLLEQNGREVTVPFEEGQSRP